MPELPVKEVRLPELHLPEISREEVLRTVSEVRRPDFDLPHVELPKVGMPDLTMPRIGQWRSGQRARFLQDMPTVDLPKLVASAIAAIGIARPRSRSRFSPRFGRAGVGVLAGVVVAAAVAAFAISRNPAARARLDAAAQNVRSRVNAMREGSPETLEFDRDDAEAATRMTLEDTDATVSTDATAMTDPVDTTETSGDPEPGAPSSMAAATEVTDVASEQAPAGSGSGLADAGSNGTSTESQEATRPI